MIRYTKIIFLLFAALLAGCVVQNPHVPTSTPQLGDIEIRSTDEANMVFVPPGEFIMGIDIEMV
ncbi:MAG: hypothetical protein PVF74_13735, partial [Anaerolineales bacterium]